MDTTPATRADLEPINKSLKRLEMAILGDEGLKIKGIAVSVHEHEKHIAGSKSRAGWFMGVSAGMGYGLHHLIEWLKSLFIVTHG